MNLPTESIFDINLYTNDGFVKICTVHPEASTPNKWLYVDVNDLLFSTHCSWVYFIVIDGKILKCGESGKQLGVKSTLVFEGQVQPKGSSVCRFGRLAQGDRTDAYLRDAIDAYLKNGHTVTLWAKPCPLHYIEQIVNGQSSTVALSMHKDLEQIYLRTFKNETGRLPWLNKSHK